MGGMDVRIVSAGAVAGKLPVLNVQTLTTEGMTGEWANLPRGEINTIEVAPDKMPPIGKIDVAGASNGRFKLGIDLYPVTEKAKLRFNFIGRNGLITVKDVSMDVYANVPGSFDEMVPVGKKHKAPARLNFIEITSQEPVQKPLRIGTNRPSYEMGFRLSFVGLDDAAPGIGSYVFSLGQGALATRGRGINLTGSSGSCDAYLDKRDEKYFGTALGKNVKVDIILKGLNRLNSSGDVVTQSHFQFTLADIRETQATNDPYTDETPPNYWFHRLYVGTGR